MYRSGRTGSAAGAPTAAPLRTTGRSASGGADLLALLAIILAINASLLVGRVPVAFILPPAASGSGAWWSWITHPFAHVSLYHAALDAGAFLLLYAALPHRTRAWTALASAAGSTGAALLAPGALAQGFCGLSGAGHGLMVATALLLMRAADESSRKVGIVALVLVLGKCGLEAALGTVVFAGWHLGDVGAPVAVCHLGGALGALAAASFRLVVRRRAW